VPRSAITSAMMLSFCGASDGIRTRVYGFAGRCLAAQPHPHKPPPWQLSGMAVQYFARTDQFVAAALSAPSPAR
jgi:hypothetical protein